MFPPRNSPVRTTRREERMAVTPALMPLLFVSSGKASRGVTCLCRHPRPHIGHIGILGAVWWALLALAASSPRSGDKARLKRGPARLF
jgi:hypothetical protein